MANRGNDPSIPAQQSDVDNIGSDMSDDLTRGGVQDERIRGVGDEGEDDDLEDEDDEIDEEEDEDGSF